ncbi:MAG: ATP-binding protein [Chloroflexi bacterium]|nr:ATP-binding protein [Chloroflexota bacterium]
MTDLTYQPEEIVLQREEYAYGFIIEVLTRGLYPNKFHVLREYVQNAYDAILAGRRDSGHSDYGRIDIKVAKPSIFIYDNGIGMDRAKINQYRYVGYSEKRTGEGVGFRGIGKLSGISVAEKLIVTSSPAGIAERYKLVFNASAMLAHILTLKLDGKNLPLNELIRTHTSITTEDEERDNHYTIVELYNVRDDSRLLMNEEELTVYLSMNVPIDFDPEFAYGSTIDAWLRKYISDYDTAPLYLNGQRIFKPYLTDLKPPQMDFIWGDDEQSRQTDGEEESHPEPLAFYWYCEHAKKGQLEDKLRRGLFYRVKNFAVGTNQLPRVTLWRSSPERAFYFFGEIHICDPEIVPSSARDDFEQNEARERLYTRGREISWTLNKLAGESTDQRRAKEFILKTERVVSSVQADFDAGQIPREIKFDKMFSVRNAIEDVKKRLHHAPEDFQERGEEVVKKGQQLIKQLDGAEPGKPSAGIYDIKQILKLGPEAARVYEIIVNCLKDEFSDKPELYERLVRRIHTALEERMGDEGLSRNGT